MRNRLFCAAVLASSISYAATPVDGWYTSAFGGYTFFPDNVHTYTPSGLFLNGSGYNDGYNAGGRVGYQSHPLRYELEYTFLHGNTAHFDLDYTEQTEATGFTSANLYMANIYYDCPEFLPALSPFLGVGIGYAYLQAVLTGSGPTMASYFSTNDSAFAYQGTAGVTYNFAENYAINFAYRYVASDKTSGFGRVFQAHIASAGVVYRFDRGNYK
jgi:opacity protein-like surface antigen